MEKFNDVMWVVFCFLFLIFIMASISTMCIIGYSMLTDEGHMTNYSFNLCLNELDVHN